MSAGRVVEIVVAGCNGSRPRGVEGRASGSRETWVEFVEYVERHRSALLRFATVLTGQVWLADDLVADALSRVYERWDRVGGLDHPHAYVRRIVVNDFVSWHRRRRRVLLRADLTGVIEPMALRRLRPPRGETVSARRRACATRR